MKMKKIICVLLLAAPLLSVLSGYRSIPEEPPDAPFSSYLDIPGVTGDDIAAIESLREEYGSFVFGMTSGTEAFMDINGEIKGYTARLCGWLTELFDIPFVPELFAWDVLLEGLAGGEIDFTGELTPSEERKTQYHMTGAIAERAIYYFRMAGNEPLNGITSRPPRYAFLQSSTTLDSIKEFLDEAAP